MSIVYLSFSWSRHGAPPARHSFPTRRSSDLVAPVPQVGVEEHDVGEGMKLQPLAREVPVGDAVAPEHVGADARQPARSEEHTSELQSPCNLVCRLLLEKKKKNSNANISTSSN